LSKKSSAAAFPKFLQVQVLGGFKARLGIEFFKACDKIVILGTVSNYQNKLTTWKNLQQITIHPTDPPF
jgi:hypothetical protein